MNWRAALQATANNFRTTERYEHIYLQAFIILSELTQSLCWMDSTWSWYLRCCTLPTGWQPRGGETLTQHMPPCYQPFCWGWSTTKSGSACRAIRPLAERTWSWTVVLSSSRWTGRGLGKYHGQPFVTAHTYTHISDIVALANLTRQLAHLHCNITQSLPFCIQGWPDHLQWARVLFGLCNDP